MQKESFAVKLRKIGPLGIIIGAVLTWFIFSFLIFPNISLLANVFIKDGQFSTEAFGKLLSSERAMKSFGNSFLLALSMVVTVNVIGTLLVLFTEYFDIKGAGLLKIGYMSTLVYGGVVLCTGYKFIYGANGIITNLLLGWFPNLNVNWFSGYFAVLFIMTFACTSNHIIFLTNAIRGIDYQTVEAAKNMGASFGRTFFSVVLPVLKPNLFALTILTFLTGLSAMSAPLIVGGPEFQTINPMIITFANSAYSRELAALMAIILGVATIILLAIMSKVEKGGNYISVSKTKSKIIKQKITNPVLNLLSHMAAYLLFVIYVFPILLVTLFSFTDSATIRSGQFSFGSLTLDNYRQLFSKLSVFKPFLISIAYSLSAALLVALLCVVVCRIIHRSKSRLAPVLEYSMLIPWLLPSTMIALALMLTFDKPQPVVLNKVLIGTVWILLIAYIVARIPFALRMIKAAFYGVETSLEEAAKSMGAGPVYTLVKVVLPIILPAVLSVVALTFNGLLAEYDMTVFLFHPLVQPLGPVIKAASDETASLNAQAMSFVYSVLLMLISSAALYLVYGRKPKRRIQEK